MLELLHGNNFICIFCILFHPVCVGVVAAEDDYDDVISSVINVFLRWKKKSRFGIQRQHYFMHAQRKFLQDNKKIFPIKNRCNSTHEWWCGATRISILSKLNFPSCIYPSNQSNISHQHMLCCSLINWLRAKKTQSITKKFRNLIFGISLIKIVCDVIIKWKNSIDTLDGKKSKLWSKALTHYKNIFDWTLRKHDIKPVDRCPNNSFKWKLNHEHVVLVN